MCCLFVVHGLLVFVVGWFCIVAAPCVLFVACCGVCDDACCSLLCIVVHCCFLFVAVCRLLYGMLLLCLLCVFCGMLCDVCYVLCDVGCLWCGVC